MHKQRGRRVLSIIMTLALCLTMNVGNVYAGQMIEETELLDVSDKNEIVTEETIGGAITEESVIEEIYEGEYFEDAVTPETPNGAAGTALAVDLTNHVIYTSDKEITIKETEGKTLLYHGEDEVSYTDLTGNPIVTALDGVSNYAVIGGNKPGGTSCDASINMESGSVQAIYGSQNPNGTGELKIRINGGTISGDGIALTKDSGKITGKSTIQLGGNCQIGKINTTNMVASAYCMVTMEQAYAIAITGSSIHNDSYIIHNHTVSGDGPTMTDVVNYIDFNEVSDNKVIGTVSGNLHLCGTLSISENEILKMTNSTLTGTSGSQIDNKGTFELYHGAVMSNHGDITISGNSLLLKEADFLTNPSITVPLDNLANQIASISEGNLRMLGISKTATRLVAHGSKVSNNSITVDTTMEEGKGEYSYTFTYDPLKDGIEYDPSIVMYDQITGRAVSGNMVPNEIKVENNKLSLKYQRYVGDKAVILRLNRGGAIYDTITIPYGSHGEELEQLIANTTGGNPEIEGKNFLGWFTVVDNEEVSILDSDFRVTASTRFLYAKWYEADRVLLAIRDFRDGTLVRKISVFGETYLSDTESINYDRDYYIRDGKDVYKAQMTSDDDDGEAYSGTTRVTSVISVSENTYTVYAKYNFEATTFNDEEGSDFSFQFKKKAKILPEGEEPVVSYTYTGRELQPKVVVKHGKSTLVENDDYVISYVNNIEASDQEAIAQITGIGIYKGTVELKFTILPKSIKGVNIKAFGSIPFDASEDDYSDIISVVDNGLLVDPSDYVLTFYPRKDSEGNPLVGKGKIRVTGSGANYSGNEKEYVEKSVRFINTEGKTNLADGFTTKVIQQQYSYTGNLIRPKAIVGNQSVELIEGVDYTLAYQNNRNVGEEAKVIAVGKGLYYGRTEAADFEITPREMKRAKIKAIGSVTYTGNVISDIKLRVKDGKNILVEGVDYTVSFNQTSSNVIVSRGSERAQVTIEAVKNEDGDYTGNYRGIKNGYFKIKRRNINNNNAVKVYTDEYQWSYSYTGKPIKPVIGLSYGGVMLEEGKDYTVTYKNNVKSFLSTGKVASLTIRGKNNFSGSRTFMFFIF